MFIFVHHPHFLADSRCVWWPIMFKSVSWFITSEIITVSEYLYDIIYKSLCYATECWRKMLWWEEQVICCGCAGKHYEWIFKIQNKKLPHLKAFYIEEWTCSLLSIRLILVQFSLISCAYIASKVLQYEYLQTFCIEVYCSSSVVETCIFLRYHLLSHVTNTMNFENWTWNRFGTSYMY